jgi:hypothetical protein
MKAEDSQVAVSSNININNKTEIAQISARHKLSEYKPLKTDKEWRAWTRHVLIMATSHGCNNVLELSKPLTTPSEQQVYDLQNKFMLILFLEKLLTLKEPLFYNTNKSPRIPMDYHSS